MIFVTIQKSTTTSLPQIHVPHYQKLNAYNIKPVQATESRLVHHYQDASFNKHQLGHAAQHTLLQQLIAEREKSRKSSRLPDKDLTANIIHAVRDYNTLVEILVKVEEIEGVQVDQTLQHFLVFHRADFHSYGIQVRQSIYLEYDPILLRHKISAEGVKKSQAILIGPKGLVTELFYLFDRIVVALNHMGYDSDTGQKFDIKA